MEFSINVHTLKSGWSVIYMRGHRLLFPNNTVFPSLKIDQCSDFPLVVSSIKTEIESRQSAYTVGFYKHIEWLQTSSFYTTCLLV